MDQRDINAFRGQFALGLAALADRPLAERIKDEDLATLHRDLSDTCWALARLEVASTGLEEKLVEIAVAKGRSVPASIDNSLRAIQSHAREARAVLERVGFCPAAHDVSSLDLTKTPLLTPECPCSACEERRTLAASRRKP